MRMVVRQHERLTPGEFEAGQVGARAAPGVAASETAVGSPVVSLNRLLWRASQVRVVGGLAPCGGLPLGVRRISPASWA
ncbi:hypothetical protein LO772_35725 [Yinghuangia sp. ASG 101]|uniref:hypothetical protein n=1 Tax=Yinghuangia sp. ASG 101 TaxID=2896848 RepID=UPI001E479F98|nr:hypothetical protein [Yinghuangia sp. ASG 101]UGQ12037.1 hypothetical protein LO772_35725 [Yinghuangia sp. ASG 101]